MISVYIVTYRNPVDLNKNIASILASGADVNINVINNHSEFFLEPEYENVVTVLHNSLRPDFSTGHLARNWNQALLHGFQDLKKPASEIVITVQDDVIFREDWFSNLINLHRQYSFISMGAGDAYCSYLPEAVQKIGLWDERFCNIANQTGDYFLRALIYNREKSSINDPWHGRSHNVIGDNIYSHENLTSPDYGDETERCGSILITSPPRNPDRENAHNDSAKFYPLTKAVFKHKWGVSPFNWTTEHFSIRNSLCPNYITYPYFEKDIEYLHEKNYIVPDDDA